MKSKKSTATCLPPKVGDRVRVKGQNSIFEVLEGPNRQRQFLVAVGSISLWIAAESLSHAAPHSDDDKRATAGHAHPPEQLTGATIDLHGHKVAEARELLEQALDRALRDNRPYLEVIHGVGTGALRKFVESFGKTSRYVRRSERSPYNPGSTRFYL